MKVIQLIFSNIINNNKDNTMDTSTKGLGFYGKDFFCIKEDEELVEESIVRLIMTNFNERVGRPSFGGNLKESIFEQLDDSSINTIETSLKDLISLYEPRAIINDLVMKKDEDNSVLFIKISFNYVGKPNNDPRTINLEINSQS